MASTSREAAKEDCSVEFEFVDDPSSLCRDLMVFTRSPLDEVVDDVSVELTTFPNDGRFLPAFSFPDAPVQVGIPEVAEKQLARDLLTASRASLATLSA